MKELLEDVETAFMDMMYMYGPHGPDEETLKDIRKRISSAGGVLAYLADIKEKVRKQKELL